MKEQEQIVEKPIVVTKLPSLEDLTDFLRAMHGGDVKVAFDITKGEFVRLEDKEGK